MQINMLSSMSVSLYCYNICVLKDCHVTSYIGTWRRRLSQGISKVGKMAFKHPVLYHQAEEIWMKQNDYISVHLCQAHSHELLKSMKCEKLSCVPLLIRNMAPHVSFFFYKIINVSDRVYSISQDSAAKRPWSKDQSKHHKYVTWVRNILCWFKSLRFWGCLFLQYI